MNYYDFMAKVSDNIHQCGAIHSSGVQCRKGIGHSVEGATPREKRHLAVKSVSRGAITRTERFEWEEEDHDLPTLP